MTKYAIERTDGGVSIMDLIAGDVWAAIEQWKITAPGMYLSHREIKSENIPSDRTFRNALKPDLTHDIEKCREIHKGRLRVDRAPLLSALDVEYQRADESGDQAAKAEVARKKQALRDLTADPRIGAAKTPDELKALVFTELSATPQNAPARKNAR